MLLQAVNRLGLILTPASKEVFVSRETIDVVRREFEGAIVHGARGLCIG